AAPQYDRSRWVGLGVVMVGVAATLAVLRPWKVNEPPPVAALAPPPPKPTALTDLPLPTSKSPEAVVAYTGAMQATRAGNWGLAEEKLRRAVALDPMLIAAQLRLAMVPEPRVPSVANRAAYAAAFQGRAALSERDQVLLHAMEPMLDHDPPDR